MNTGTLTNKVVLELGSMIAAPFATHILSQMGAKVIKIEPPSGETTRKLVRGGPSGTYIAYNRGKESICLNLQTEAGQEVFRKLVETADIVVHNLSPGAARRLKVTQEICTAINPKIIYCHIKGYAAGPMEEEVASNPIAEAATGVMYSNRIDGRPSRLGPSYHDQFAGCYAVMGILAALADPNGSSKFQNIEIGLYETGLHIAARDLVAVQLKSQMLGRAEQEPSPEFSIPGYGAYETRDNKWIYLVMLTDKHWHSFCQATSIDHDPNLATLRQRRKQRPRVEGLVRDVVKTQNFENLSKDLAAEGIGFTEVLSMDQVLEAPQACEPQKFSDISFAQYAFQAPDFPLNSANSEADMKLSPPLLGEHSQLLLSQLGYDESAIQSMFKNGVAHADDPDVNLWAV